MDDFYEMDNELSTEEVADFERNSRGRLPGDTNSVVRFFKYAMLDEDATKAAGGIKKYQEFDCIEIKTSGVSEKEFVFKEFANDSHRFRFPNEWKAYTNKTQASLAGTPLSALKGIGAARQAELKQFNVTTIEALAEIPDSTLAKIHGLVDVKKRAISFLENSTKAAMDSKAAEYAKEIAELKAQRENELAANAVLKQQMSELMAMMQELKKDTKAKPTPKSE